MSSSCASPPRLSASDPPERRGLIIGRRREEIAVGATKWALHRAFQRSTPLEGTCTGQEPRSRSLPLAVVDDGGPNNVFR